MFVHQSSWGVGMIDAQKIKEEIKKKIINMFEATVGSLCLLPFLQNEVQLHLISPRFSAFYCEQG